MRLIGFCRRKLDTSADVETVFRAVESKFSVGDYKMALEDNRDIEHAEPFSVQGCAKKLYDSSSSGFFRKDVVGVIIENQTHKGRYFVYPHSTVEIETMGNDSGPILGTQDWLSLAEMLVATTQLDLALVMGARENASDYYRTPLGCGIGLIKVFWINCFGVAYAELIQRQPGPTSFFKREDFGTGCKAFVSAPTYEAYRSVSPELLVSQRREIGEDLFNRLPAEKPGKGGAYWILNPKIIFRLISFLYRQSTTDWSRYQAKIVPEHYVRGAIK